MKQRLLLTAIGLCVGYGLGYRRGFSEIDEYVSMPKGRAKAATAPTTKDGRLRWASLEPPLNR